MANAFAFEFIEPIWVAQQQINGPHAAIVLARVNDPLVVIDPLLLQSTTVLPLSTAGALQESETANRQFQHWEWLQGSEQDTFRAMQRQKISFTSNQQSTLPYPFNLCSHSAAFVHRSFQTTEYFPLQFLF